MCESFKCPCGLTEAWVLTFPHPLPRGLEEAALSPISNLPWLKQFKLEHQILTLPRKCLQELDVGAKVTQYIWIFKILKNHELIPRRAHTTRPLDRTRCSCGGPEAPLNSGGCGNNRGGGRGQAPVIPEAGGPQASFGLCWYQTKRVLEDPVSASVPLKSRRCRLRVLVGLHSFWEVSLCHPTGQ